MDINDSEMRAAEIVYERDHGQKVAYSEIPEAERELIIKQIKERELKIEWFATNDMLVKKIGEDRRTPRRHMIAAMAVGVIMLVVILLLLGVFQLFGWQ